MQAAFMPFASTAAVRLNFPVVSSVRALGSPSNHWMKKKEEVHENQDGSAHKKRKKNRIRTDGGARSAASISGGNEPHPSGAADRLRDPSAFQEGADHFARRRLREPLLLD